jgi:hypothetical protein
MGRRALDIEGKTFGRLTVMHRIFPNKYKNQANFLCKCACGRAHEAVSSVLVRGGAQSCGCLVKHRMSTHGLTYHRLYNTWVSMVDRCSDATNPSYPRYGGRGIAVCIEWQGSKRGLGRFIADMGERPKGYTLDRIDNDGPYCKANCQWATPKEQVLKQGRTRILSYDGRSGSITDWSRWTGLGSNTIRSRLSAGQTLESALVPERRRWLFHSTITYTSDRMAPRPSAEKATPSEGRFRAHRPSESHN